MSSSTSVILIPAAAIASIYDCFFPSLAVCGSLAGFAFGFGAGWAVGAARGFAVWPGLFLSPARLGSAKNTLAFLLFCFGNASTPWPGHAVPRDDICTTK